MKFGQALERLVQTVFAEALRVRTLQVFEHGCEGTTIHQLHEDPQTVLVIEGFITLNDGIVL